MCLETIDKETENVTEGWKVFRTINDKLYGLFQDIKFKTNKWIKDPEDEVLFTYCDEKYQTGFHFYFNKEDAEKCVVEWEKRIKHLYLFIKVESKLYKVKVRNVVATGLQYNDKVGVAREIFIEDHN